MGVLGPPNEALPPSVIARRSQDRNRHGPESQECSSARWPARLLQTTPSEAWLQSARPRPPSPPTRATSVRISASAVLALLVSMVQQTAPATAHNAPR